MYDDTSPTKPRSRKAGATYTPASAACHDVSGNGKRCQKSMARPIPRRGQRRPKPMHRLESARRPSNARAASRPKGSSLDGCDVPSSKRLACRIRSSGKPSRTRRGRDRYGESATAAFAAKKPIFECVPSQNGFVVDAPQRHSATVVFPLRSISFPSASRRTNGPFTRSGPEGRREISTSAIRRSYSLAESDLQKTTTRPIARGSPEWYGPVLYGIPEIADPLREPLPEMRSKPTFTRVSAPSSATCR